MACQSHGMIAEDVWAGAAMTESHNLGVALRYASAGLKVFPVILTEKIDPETGEITWGKNPPPGLKWAHEATTNTAKIREWWERWPDAGVGWPQGQTITVDADRHGGPDGVAELAKLLNGSGQGHPIVDTAGGGEHHIFLMPAGMELGNREGALKGRGINIRGKNGFIVAPGTLRPDGKLWRARAGTPGVATALQNKVLPELPKVIVDLILADTHKPPTQPTACPASVSDRERRYADEALAGMVLDVMHAPKGSRNNELNAKAYKLGRIVAAGWLDEGRARAAIAAAGAAAGLDADEIPKTVISGFEAGKKKLHEALAERQPERPGIKLKVGDKEYVFGKGARPDLGNPDMGGDSDPILIEVDDEITDVSAPAGIIKGVIGLGQLVAVWGASTAGKTFVALDAAFAIARAEDWFGKRVRASWLTLYVNLEGVTGFRNRVFAITKEAGATTGGRFARITVSPTLNKSTGGDEGVATIIKAASQLTGRNGGEPVGLIVIDTLARAMAGDDENTAQDMAAFINRCAAIAATTGAAIMIVHHGGKDDARGMRGSSALFAACDTVLKVEAIGEVRTITAEKVKDGEIGPIGAFKLKRVVLGYDEDNEEITSCVVEPADAPTGPKRKRGRPKAKTANHERVLEAVLRAIEESGESNPGFSGIPAGIKTLTKYAAVMRHATMFGVVEADDEAKYRNRRLKTYLNDWVQENRIGFVGNYVWEIKEVQ
jgi:hypothetical protein